jgi:hypothetical protein
MAKSLQSPHEGSGPGLVPFVLGKSLAIVGSFAHTYLPWEDEYQPRSQVEVGMQILQLLPTLLSVFESLCKYNIFKTQVRHVFVQFVAIGSGMGQMAKVVVTYYW